VSEQRIARLEAQVASLQLAAPRNVLAVRALELRAMLASAPMIFARFVNVRDYDLPREVARIANEHLGDSCSPEERAFWERLREVAA
jgi:hypothetical protein